MNILEILKTHLSKTFLQLGYDQKFLVITFSNRPDLCDFQCNSCFALAKEYGVNPSQIAEKIIENSEELKKFFDINFFNGFINFVAKTNILEQYANYLLDNELVEKHKDTKKIIMDYGGANVAKELHVGHLRSPLIGESLKRLHVLFGDSVTSDTHLGDWGLQMGLTIAQLEDDGYLGNYFNNGEKKIITLDTLNEAYPKASLRKKSDNTFAKRAEDYTLFLQQKKQPYYDIWKEIRKISVAQIEKDYLKLNVKFDLFYGESTSSDSVPKILDIFIKNNLCHNSCGALVVDVAKEGEHVPMPKNNPDDPNEEVRFHNPMPPAIIQKYNGGELYVTTDLATIYDRSKENPDEIIYITDKRQATHFEQVFRCARKANLLPITTKLTHIGFGTMNGADGKPFKTRDGGMIKLSDVINMLTEKAKEKLDKNNISYDEKLPLMIGVAAMKFGDMSNTVSKDYIFDLDKFASFEGKTGPYIQYTAVRINSLLEKSDKNFGKITINSSEEKNIIMSIIKLTESFDICYKEKSLNSLCDAVYNLASAFSLFYNNTKVLSQTDDKLRNGYLSLCKLVYKAIALTLNVLAIDIPEKM